MGNLELPEISRGFVWNSNTALCISPGKRKELSQRADFPSEKPIFNPIQEEERLVVELRWLLGLNSHTSLYRNFLSCPRMEHLGKAQ